MTHKTIISILFCFLLSLKTFAQYDNKENYKIQIALLIDVSGSMNGLINQAKGQIWRLVNELTSVEKKGQKVTIEIALGSFGNVSSEENGYFRLHTPLTSDIDLISEQLFDLSSEGSNEYCGFAIQIALDSLDWSSKKKDLKIIFIAGNESFANGDIDYTKICNRASKEGVLINTIYCGTDQEGVYNLWADAATKGNGKFMTIQQDSTLKLNETLWDDKIFQYNDKLNKTFVPYGQDGKRLVLRQISQDENALLLGNAYMRERVKFKISNNYQNAHWDLVDAYRIDSLILDKLESSDFSGYMKSMTENEQKRYLQQKQMKRDVYIEGIIIYLEKAEELLMISGIYSDNFLTLDNSIINTIIEQGEEKNFDFKQ